MLETALVSGFSSGKHIDSKKEKVRNAQARWG
jgi:hypothetical protein